MLPELNTKTLKLFTAVPLILLLILLCSFYGCYPLNKEYEDLLLLILIFLMVIFYAYLYRYGMYKKKLNAYVDELSAQVTTTKEELNEQKNVYEAIFYHSFDAMALIKDGIFTLCNDSAIKMFGFESTQEIIGRHPADLSPEFQPDGQTSAEKTYKLLADLANKGRINVEWLGKRVDGTHLWLDVSLDLITLKGEVYALAIWRDSTKQKELHQRLESFNTELKEQIAQEVKKNHEQTLHMLKQSRLATMGEMLSMIAHQWRQPLASISTIVGTLTFETEIEDINKERFLKRFEDISALSEHLSSTINDFRDFFRGDKNQEPVMLSALIHESLKIIGPSLEAKGIATDIDVNHSVEVVTYPNEVKQVLLNILTNAKDIFDEKQTADPNIWIKADQNSSIFISVEDNAGGVPEEIIEKVFDPYFSTKTNKDGTGLGLYMSKRIIEENCNGELKVENTQKGAKFVIILP